MRLDAPAYTTRTSEPDLTVLASQMAITSVSLAFGSQMGVSTSPPFVPNGLSAPLVRVGAFYEYPTPSTPAQPQNDSDPDAEPQTAS